MEEIKYKLLNEDFTILKIYISVTKMNPLDEKEEKKEYYFFTVNTFNLDKRIVPIDATVNGIKAISLQNKYHGQYAIRKDLATEPLEINIESSPAHLIHFLNVKTKDSLGVGGERVEILISDPLFDRLALKGEKAKFRFFKSGTKEEIIVNNINFVPHPVASSLYFPMPEEDIDILIESEKDEDVTTLNVDESAIEEFEYTSDIYNYPGIVTTALYSDYYDFGVADHYFYEKDILFYQGSELKVVIYLKEKKDVICLLNDKEYEVSSLEEQHLEYDDGHIDILYVYTYSPLLFLKKGILSFKIKE